MWVWVCACVRAYVSFSPSPFHLLLHMHMFKELQDVPLYYVLDNICSTMHANTPKMLAMRYVDILISGIES